MFKKEFKYYKSRCSDPDYANVVDLRSRNNHRDNKVSRRVPTTQNDCYYQELYGLSSISEWKIYEFTMNPGLIFIVNPFTTAGQQYWVERCLKQYTRKPNRLNLDPFNELQPGEDWWQATQSNDNERGQKLLQKLRWATLGYHHNWDTKVYSEEARDEFPSELAGLSKLVVDVLYGPATSLYRAEAAIVNFYHLDSTLSGHKDVSEPNMDSPLLSISFGQSAVFLVGGDALDDPVTAMLLHSGDIVVMSGPARSSYHGVPRVLMAPRKPWQGAGWELNPCGRYLETSRININIRQVLLPGQTSVT